MDTSIQRGRYWRIYIQNTCTQINSNRYWNGEKDGRIATKDPRKDYELPVSTWPLRVLAGYVLKELNLVNSIGHTEISNILLRYGIKYRQSKLTLCISTDPDHLKKKNWRAKIHHHHHSYNLCPTLYEDEKVKD
jgi:hypothetical protein